MNIFLRFLIIGSLLVGWRVAYSETVFVSILPQKYFVEYIAGDHLQVEVLVGTGQSPATYEPRPTQMVALGRARLYLSIGTLPFEQAWLNKIRAMNPELRIVSTSRNIELHPNVESHTDHHHGDLDPHIWLSPPLAIIMVENIRAALSENDPAHADDYARNAARLQTELEQLHQSLLTLLHPFKHSRFLVFHPSWGYFAKTYGLHQIAIEVQGKEPGPSSLARMIEQAKQQNIHVVFVQQQFSRRQAETIAHALGAQVVSLDPLAENYQENLRAAAQAFADVLQPAPSLP